MALGIIVIGLLSVFGFIARALSANRIVSNQFTGAYLASEGIEVIKNIIDGNIMQDKPWNSGFGSADYEVDYTSLNLIPSQNRNLSFDGNSGYWGYSIGSPSIFKRTVKIRMIDTDEIQANSVVRWADRSGVKEINVEDHFYNWRPSL